MRGGQLRKVYDCFTEGFDTKDLVEAKTLMGELCASETLRRAMR